MPRIRTIKPEFFRHEGLYDAERETGLPIRLAFAGLWTECDREGRFEWRPRRLKVSILPYDEIDFSEVLDALEHWGFIIRYEVEGAKYGHVPSFLSHQCINNKEPDSEIPSPQEVTESISRVSHASVTREPRVSHACGTRTHLNLDENSFSRVERKGRERKGKEGKGIEENASHSHVVGSDDATGEGSPIESSVDPTDVMNAWNELAEQADLPKIQQLTPDRKKAIRQRSKDAFWRDNWRAAIDKVRGSPFLCGAGNRGWRMDFNFFIRKGKVLEIIEGKYDNAAPPESELPF